MSERDVFTAAREITDPAARSAYLDGACAGDRALRERVEALLRAHDTPDSLLDVPAVSRPVPEPAATREYRAAGAAPDDGPTRTQGEAAGDDTDDALAFLSPPTRPDSLGRIGHYEVLEVLGRGGFGVVFRAFDDVLQRVVAVKVLAPSLAVTSPARKRFLREARSSAPIQHENVVRIHDVGEQPLPYLVMEFIRGETLQQRLDRTGPLDSSDALRIGRQVAEGLAAAHAAGLIHRDIKPSNILLDDGPHRHVKITDFGLARAADDASLTRSGVVAGTPMYMAPEQARGEALDHRADLFSLGSVLYTLLTGRPPFRAETTLAVLKRVAEDTPRPIREVIPEVPEWLCRIVEKLHAKDPAERYQTAKEVADVLADCERQLQSAAALTDFTRIPAGKPRRRIGRKVKWAAVAAVALLLGAAWFGRAALLYLSNSGELEFRPEEGLVSVIVLRNDEGVIDGDKLHAPVTDWLGMKTSHTLKLPPGRYQVNVGTWPAGTRVSQWAVTTSGLFGGSEAVVPVIETSAIVTVDGGQRVTLRPKMRTDPPRKEPPAAGPEAKAGAPFRLVVTSRPGQLDSTLLGEPTREANLAGLARVVETTGPEEPFEIRGLPADPHDLGVQELRLGLLEVGRRHAGKPPAMTAAKMLAQVPSPLDAWRRERITPEQFAAMGYKDPAACPAEVVGVIDVCKIAQGSTGVDELPFVAVDHDFRFAAAWAGTEVVVVDLATGDVRFRLKGPGRYMTAAAFSPDRRTVATAGLDGQIKTWDLATGAEGFTLPGLFFTLAFSPDGKRLTAGGGNHLNGLFRNLNLVSVWDLEKRELLRGSGPPVLFTATAVALGPDGKTVAATGPGGAVAKWWELATGKELQSKQTGRAYAGRAPVAFSADGKLVVAGGEQPSLKVWDTATGREERTLTADSTVFDLAYSPDGSLLAAEVAWDKVTLWDARTYTRGATIPVKGMTVAVAPDSRHLFVHQGERVVILRLKAARAPAPGGAAGARP